MNPQAQTVRREAFGTMADGTTVEAITLAGPAGVSVRLLTLGAAIQSVFLPGRDGQVADVALGFATLDEYLADTAFVGVTVGRVANRIAGGRFTLDGRHYEVPANNGPNALHGGPSGWNRANWQVVSISDGPPSQVTLRHLSPDGDMGFPGAVDVTATFTLGPEGLDIEYRATTDAPTLVNLSHHAYWNLAGEGDPEGAMGHLLTVPAEHFHPTDETAIPTGEFRPVEGTPFDFRQATPVGARVRDGADAQIRIGRGYDHNWAIAREVAPDLRLLARVEHPASGRMLEVHSNQPGLQIYSGNFLDGSVAGKSGRLYRQGDALVLEPQMPPDTPNQPAFGSIRLDPGETYVNRIRFGFGVAR